MRKILIKLPYSIATMTFIWVWRLPRNAGVMELAPVMFMELWFVLCVRVVGGRLGLIGQDYYNGAQRCTALWYLSR